MAEARVERRLAAILAADVAGYSRLMEADEEATLRELKAHRAALIDPSVAEHRGRIVKTTGDGALYLALSPTKSIAQWKAQEFSDNPVYVAYCERLYEGLRKAGMAEA